MKKSLCAVLAITILLFLQKAHGQGDFFRNVRPMNRFFRQRFGAGSNIPQNGQRTTPQQQTQQPQETNNAPATATGVPAGTANTVPRQLGTVTVPVIGPFPSDAGAQTPSGMFGMGQGPFNRMGQSMMPPQGMAPFGGRAGFNPMLTPRQQQMQRPQRPMFPFGQQQNAMPPFPSQFGSTPQRGIDNSLLRDGEQMLILPNSMAQALMSMRNGNRRELRRLAFLGIPRSLLSTFAAQPEVFANLRRQTSNTGRARTGNTGRTGTSSAGLARSGSNGQTRTGSNGQTRTSNNGQTRTSNNGQTRTSNARGVRTSVIRRSKSGGGGFALLTINAES